MNKAFSLRPLVGLVLLVLLAVQAVPAEGQAVRIGVLANRGEQECLTQWAPTARYLTLRLPGREFTIVPLDFSAFYPAVAEGRVDFVVTNSAMYVRAEKDYGAVRIASMRNLVLGRESSYFGGVIFYKAGRQDIKSLASLKGKRFVAVEPDSLGGWLAALAEFKRAGLDPGRDFLSLEFAGTHDKAVYAVRDGRADAGTVRTDILERMISEGSIGPSDFTVLPGPGTGPLYQSFPFLLSTELYPEWAFAKLPQTPDDLARQVAAILLTMPAQPTSGEDDGPQAWTIPLNYEPVHDLLKLLRRAPYEDYGRISPRLVLLAYWPHLSLLIMLLAGVALMAAHFLRLSTRYKASREALTAELAKGQEVENTLFVKEARIRSLFNATSDSVILIDRQGTILDINDIAAKRRNSTPAELIGKCLYDTLPPGPAQARRQGVSEVLVTARPVFFEEKRGEHFYRIRIWPILGENGQVINLATFSLEITDFKQAEQAIRESEAKYRTLADFTVDWEYWLGPDGRFVDVSPSCLGITGYSSDEFYADPGLINRITHPEDRERMVEHMRQSITEELTACNFDFRIIAADGEVHWINHRCAPIRREDGTWLGRRACNRDITDRHRIRLELVVLKNLLQNILDSMPSALVVVDEELHLTFWNNQAAKLSASTLELAKGKPVETVFPELAGERQAVLAAMHDRNFCLLPKKVRHEGGESRWEEVTIYPLVSGGADGAVIRIDDVTNRVRMEEMVVQSEKMMSVAGLAAGMAHEINNPLGIIVQAVQNAMRRTSPDLPANTQVAGECGVDLAGVIRYLHERRVDKYHSDILEAGVRAAKIVDSMLNFSRRSTSRLDLHDMNALIDKSIELILSDYDLKKNYDIKKVRIEKRYAPDSLIGRFVETEIEQVLLNIIKNAAQAMAEKTYAQGQGPAIVISTAKEGRFIRVDLEDNGPGMDEITRKRIMEPFYTTKKAGRGTGLGLAVSYFIITNNYRGELLVDSEPGRGTRFTLRLPEGEVRDAA